MEVSVEFCVVVSTGGEPGGSVSEIVVGTLEVVVRSGEVKGIVEAEISVVVVRLTNAVVVKTGGGKVKVVNSRVVVKILSGLELVVEAISVVVSGGSGNIVDTIVVCVEVSDSVVVKIGAVVETVDRVMIFDDGRVDVMGANVATYSCNDRLNGKL